MPAPANFPLLGRTTAAVTHCNKPSAWLAITWLAATNVPLPQNNCMVATIGQTNNSVFYRLIAP
jgi:hypothetical protein